MGKSTCLSSSPGNPLVLAILTCIPKDFNTFETSIARTDFDLQTPLDDAQVVSALCPQVDFQEVLQLLKVCPLRESIP